MSLTFIRRQPFLILLITAAFVVPTSPRLVFSGIPFLSPIEVGAVTLLMIALINRDSRINIYKQVQVSHIRSVVVLGLIALIFLKILLFAKFPLQDGFEACYKSTYDTVGICEKSYNSPFYRNDDINGLGDITRVDSSLNFGSTSTDPNSLAGLSKSNWNLPFTNDYPRFSALWMDRLPFEASYAGVVEAEKRGYIPIEFTGELNIALGVQTFKFNSYGARKKLLIPIDKGKATIKIQYRFRDTYDTKIPESSPKPNGPYASLFLGQVVSSFKDLNQHLVVKGWVANTSPNNGVKKIVLLDQSGKTLQTNSTYYRPDVHQALAMSAEQNTGFAVSSQLPNTKNERDATYYLNAIFSDGTSKRIANINWAGLVRIADKPNVVFKTDDSLITNLDFAAIEISHKSPTLKVERSNQPPFLWKLLLIMVDGLQFLGLLLMLLSIFVTTRLRIYRGVKYALSAGLIITVPRALGLGFAENQITFEIIVCVVLFAHFYRRDPRGRWIAIVLSFGFILLPPLLKFLQRFYGIGVDHWWGQLIFRWRDSDWFVYQGYARQIFVHESLRGGESVFYFMPGMRYLVYLEHLVFGENDLLIALASSIAMISITAMVLFAALKELPKPYNGIIFGAFAMLLIQLNQPLMLELSMMTAAEVPAWILFMCASVLAFRKSANEFQRNVAAALLGLVANFRPNYVFAVIWTFLLLTIVVVLIENGIFNKALSLARITISFMLTISLSLLHNLYYGGSGKPFTNISDPGQKDFEPSELLQLFSNPDIRNLVGKKLMIALRWNNVNVFNPDVFAAIGIQVMWVACVLLVIQQRRNIAVCVFALSTPLALLISYMPFHFTDIPQRHFLMISITFAISAMSAVMLLNIPFCKTNTLSTGETEL